MAAAAAETRFSFPGQDHTVGPVLCDYLDRDRRVRASGYIVRDGVLHLQVDADAPHACVQEAIAFMIRDIQTLRRSLQAQL